MTEPEQHGGEDQQIENLLRAFWRDEGAENAIMDSNERREPTDSSNASLPPRSARTQLYRRLDEIDVTVRWQQSLRFIALAASILVVVSLVWYSFQNDGPSVGPARNSFLASGGLSIYPLSATRSDDPTTYWIGDSALLSLHLATPAIAYVYLLDNDGTSESINSGSGYRLEPGEVRLPPPGSQVRGFRLDGSPGKKSFLVVLADQSMSGAEVQRIFDGLVSRIDRLAVGHDEIIKRLIAGLQESGRLQVIIESIQVRKQE